jgi:hypothetical protein
LLASLMNTETDPSRGARGVEKAELNEDDQLLRQRCERSSSPGKEKLERHAGNWTAG